MKPIYFTPFCTDKKYGDSRNACFDLVGPDDWVCLRDIDTMALTTDFGNLVEEAIKLHGDKYELFGCLTNRLGTHYCKHQLYNGELSDNTDILHHVSIAEQCRQDKTVTECNLVSGMFQLMRKSTWERLGGFNNSIRFDIEFSYKCRENGVKMGIINSIYLFHAYRLRSGKNPEYDYHHLL